MGARRLARHAPQAARVLGHHVVRVPHPRGDGARRHEALVDGGAGDLRVRDGGDGAARARHEDVLHREVADVGRDADERAGGGRRHDVGGPGAVRRVVPVWVVALRHVVLGVRPAVGRHREAESADEERTGDAQQEVDVVGEQVEAVIVRLQDEAGLRAAVARPAQRRHRLVGEQAVRLRYRHLDDVAVPTLLDAQLLVEVGVFVHAEDEHGAHVHACVRAHARPGVARRLARAHVRVVRQYDDEQVDGATVAGVGRARVDVLDEERDAEVVARVARDVGHEQETMAELVERVDVQLRAVAHEDEQTDGAQHPARDLPPAPQRHLACHTGTAGVFLVRY